MNLPDLSGPADVVAPLLLGTHLVSDLGGARVRLRITEVEAYAGTGNDPGSHAHRGRTARNATMFGPPGRAYVYFTYGMHWCCNVVVGSDGEAAAVLLRAGEVIDGLEVARARRTSSKSTEDLARGPARLCVALGIDGAMDGVDLTDPAGPLRLLRPAEQATGHGTEPGDQSRRLGVSPRTGVAGDGALTPWRFYLSDEPTVSPYRAATPRRRGGASR